MDIRIAMKNELAHEADLTRSVLNVIPDGLLDVKAHPSVRSIRWNVSHLVDILSWAPMILHEAYFDVAPPGEPPHDTPEMATIADAITTFDQNLIVAQGSLDQLSVDTLDDPWSLRVGGQPVLTHPRYMIYRMYMVNHVAHHRGHLLAYLRINDIETPRLYE